MSSPYKALFISHGAGPMPLLGDAGHMQMRACLDNIAAHIPKPDAIVVVSAHWEADQPTVLAAAQPPLLYDYYNFPAAAYDIRYPCMGSPELAVRIQQLLGNAGIEASLEESRRFDHGLFVPLKIMYPQADIPCIQLSLVNSLDAATHIAMGRALAGLERDNILVIGSGFSYHNMRGFRQPATAEAQQLNVSFEDWLKDTCSNSDYSEAAREQRLLNWETAPGARFCHPREEHLLPLHVCYGVAQAAASRHYALDIAGKRACMLLW